MLCFEVSWREDAVVLPNNELKASFTLLPLLFADTGLMTAAGEGDLALFNP